MHTTGRCARIFVASYIFQEVITLHIHYGNLLRILHWCVDQIMTEALKDMELTAAQGHIMGYLSRQPEPPCPRDVEEAFHLSHPTVSGLLSRLEQKGFIQFRPDPLDRRCKRIYVLPKGQACHDTMHQIIRTTEDRIVQDFSPEEKAQFSALLQRAISNLGGSTSHSKEESTE